MNDQPIEVEVMRADPRRKRRAYVLVAALVIAGALLKLLGLPALMRWLTVSDNTLLLHRIALVFAGLSALMAAAAAYTGWHATRILRSNQSPPPHSWLLRDTQVAHGTSAIVRGWLVMASAVAFVVLAIYAAMLPGYLRAQVDSYRSFRTPTHRTAPPEEPGPPTPRAPIIPHPHKNTSSLPSPAPHG